MSASTALLLVPTVIGLVNLLLVVGVIRRLRDHETRLAGFEAGPAVPLGSPVGMFSATSTRGVRLSSEMLPAHATIGVFAAGCEPCHRQLPDFVAYTRQLTDPVAVVLTGGVDHADLVARLEETCHVVVEPPGGPVSTALRVPGTPTLLRIENGVVTAAESAVDRLLATAVATPA